MSSRSKKMLSLANGSINTTLPIQRTSNKVYTNKNLTQGKENNNHHLNSRRKLDDKKIWSHYIPLEDMKEIKNRNFEYSSSYEYIKQCNLLQLTQGLSNKQFLQPIPENPKNPDPLQVTASTEPVMTQPASSEPASTQPATKQPASSEPASTQQALTQSASTEPAFIEMVLTPPNLSQSVLVQLAHLEDKTSTEIGSEQVKNNDLITLEDLLCSEIMQESAEIFHTATPLADMPVFEDSDDSVADKNYVPEPSNNSSDHMNSDAEQSSSKQRSKKRKTSTILKSAKKLKKNQDKYYIRPPCHNLCKKLCSFNFSEDKRLSIHADYWSMDWESRGIFLKGLVYTDACAKTNTKINKKRNVTHKYHFYDNSIKIEVCKTFFLCTLGYDRKNDRHVLSAIGKEIADQKDKRDGRNLKISLIDKNLLTKHVNSFNPCVHHYRRAHAPNKKYLPSDLTIKMMHENFITLHPEVKCCFETYRNHVSNVMNISFAKLGHEECETCEIFSLHNPEHVKDGQDPECETCNNYAKHKQKYTKARKHYDVDSKRVPNEEDVYVSVDLQKVIMLPRLDSFKTAIFCPRLVTYNETFVPLGKYTSSNPVYAVTWHEAISGRKQEDLVSAFRAFFVSKRDAATITIWLDNCSAQNKNWCLLTYLIGIINSSDIVASKIILKYFEPGHTFMSADSFHHNVEQSLNKKKKVYDFEDFCHVIEIANSGKINVKKMEITDFFVFKSHIAQQKLKNGTENKVYLKDIVEVMVNRGNYCLFYKTDFDAEEYSQLNCLKSKKLPKPDKRCMPRGITSTRKQNIIKSLGPLMPENRMAFWKSLPLSAAETDDAPEAFIFDNDNE